MTLDEYKRAAMRTAGIIGNTDAIIVSALGLSGEAGEYTESVKKLVYHGHDVPLGKFLDELGDILWYLALACEAHGFGMDYVARTNLTKLVDRYPDGFSVERSINRKDRHEED